MSEEWGEGFLYYVIRRDDAAAARFDRALGVYQQT